MRTLTKRYRQLLLFWFHFLDLLIKIYEDEAVVHLVLPPHPCHMSARTFCSLPHSTCADLPVLPPPPPAHLRGGGGGPIAHSRFWLVRGEGGDRYNTTTCGTAKDTKDPCISHVDALHAERPRTESSLLFCNFFYIVKIIEKSLFYEPEIGFIDKITSQRRIRYFFNFFRLKTF